MGARMPETLAFRLGQYVEWLRQAADRNEQRLREERAGLPGTSVRIQAQLEERVYMQRTIARELETKVSG